MSNTTTPTQITIAVPLPTSRTRGVHAVTQFGPILRARTTQHDYSLIEEEARILGLDVSKFVRWCTIMSARELRRLRTGEVKDVEL